MKLGQTFELRRVTKSIKQNRTTDHSGTKLVLSIATECSSKAHQQGKMNLVTAVYKKDREGSED